MHTEEFVLIPKAMFTEEKPQIAQVLGNRNLSDKNAFLSVIQRNQNSSKPENVIERKDADTMTEEKNTTVQSQQTDKLLDQPRSETGDDLMSEEGQVEMDIKNFNVYDAILEKLSARLQGVKFDHCKTILSIIADISRFIIDNDSWVVYIGSKKRMCSRMDEFLYNVQQNTKKLNLLEYFVLNELQLQPQLVSNTNARKFLALDVNRQKEFMREYKISKQEIKLEDISFDDDEYETFATPEKWKSRSK